MIGKNFFYELLETGQLRVTDNGTVVFLGEYNLMLPTRVFLKLQKMLTESLGEKGEKILYELGAYQIKHAFDRYKKMFNVQEMDKIKIEEFGLKLLAAIGYGVFEVIEIDPKNGTGIIINKKLPTAELFRLTNGISKKPIDFFICGLLAEAVYTVFGKKVGCIETKCLACGDPYCQFEFSPKIKD